MTAFKLDSRNRVKLRARPCIDLGILLQIVLLFSLLLPLNSSSEESKPSGSSVQTEELPDIEARTFVLWPDRRSRSGKTYLFHDVEGVNPIVGRILLLKTPTEPVMAFRVLKQYPEKKQFAAKTVKIYGRVAQLENKKIYTAVEKLADIVPPPLTEAERKEISELESTGAPPPGGEPLPPVPSVAADDSLQPPAQPEPPITAPSPGPSLAPQPPVTAVAPEAPPLPAPPADNADSLSELSKLEKENNAALGAPPPEIPPPSETPVPPTEGEGSKKSSSAKDFDQELDAGSSPQPAENDEEREPADAKGDPNVVVEETPLLDPYVNSLSFAFGFYRIVANGTVYNPPVGGFRFGKTIGNNILVRKPTLQDSFTVEGAVYFLKALNLGSTQMDDAYLVAPLVLTGRYNLFLSTSFAAFLYAGIQKGIVLEAIQGSTPGNTYNQILSDLGAFGPALGVGLFFQIGPNWEFRADLGYEMIGLGLMLRF